MKRQPSPEARKALEKMKMEIASEFDANITGKEKSDGVMVNDLVQRAEKKIEELEEDL